MSETKRNFITVLLREERKANSIRFMIRRASIVERLKIFSPMALSSSSQNKSIEAFKQSQVSDCDRKFISRYAPAWQTKRQGRKINQKEAYNNDDCLGK